MAETRIYAIPGTMCDKRIWNELRKQRLDLKIEHVAIPNGGDVNGIVEKIADLLPETPINLLGFSLGGYIASAFSVRYPRRIKRLVVLSNSPSSLPADELELRQLTLNWLKENHYQGVTKERIDTLLHPDNRSRAELHTIIRDMDRAGGKAMLMQQLSSTSVRKDLSGALAESEFPIDFIYGERDSLVDDTLIEKIQSCRDSINRTVIKGAGHMLPLEQAEPLAIRLNVIFRQ